MNTSPSKDVGMPPRNSKTDPLRIDSMPLSKSGAILGLTMRPGRKMRSMTVGFWDRSFDEDLLVIKEWSPHVVLELGERHDSGHDVQESYRRTADEIAEFAIYRYFNCPDQAFLASWERIAFLQICDWIHLGLQDDRDPLRILVISERGLLRAGLAAAHILFTAGFDRKKIPGILEDARPGSFDTGHQHALFGHSLDTIRKEVQG